MARGRVLRRSAAAPRRQTQWIALTVNWTNFSASTFVNMGQFAQAQLVNLVPFTIVRTVGICCVSIDPNPILNQDFSMAFGGCVAREQSGNQLPAPFANADSDAWFWHQFAAMEYETDTGGDNVISMQIPVDSKAQRKVSDGDKISFLAQGGSAADGFEAALYLRILLKLH